MSKALFSGNLPKDLQAIAVIMAGGSGTRFWPMSRRSCPKQFLLLQGDSRSLIQATAERLEPLATKSGVMVVTASTQAELVREHLPHAAILAEPIPRNTAPCIGFAALKILDEVGDVPMLCLPADHLVSRAEGLLSVYQSAIEFVSSSDVLATIGIVPTRPETGYGYIRRGSALEKCSGIYTVQSFVEKPDVESAEAYVNSGEYFWNSGMFIWRPSVILAAIERFLPDIYRRLCEVKEAFGEEDEWDRALQAFSQIQPVSIDEGVMERADNVVLLSGEGFDWSDIGHWTSWVESMSQSGTDAHQNYIQGDALVLNSEECAVVGNRKLIAAVGLKDIIIVDTEDALLVCHRESAQDVKELVERLKEANRDELL